MHIGGKMLSKTLNDTQLVKIMGSDRDRHKLADEFGVSVRTISRIKNGKYITVKEALKDKRIIFALVYFPSLEKRINNINHKTALDILRFLNNLRKQGNCLVFTGAMSNNGYGSFQVGGKPISTHRYAFEVFYGKPLLEGAVVCHKCDNKICCYGKHLFSGSSQDNSTDMVNKDRQAKGIKINTAKLIPKQVRQIRESDRPCRQLAKKYGVGFAQISRIKRRVCWKHLKD